MQTKLADVKKSTFNSEVIQSSFDKPVLVKEEFILTQIQPFF
ncbi:MAG TPA: hypothetical protein VH186_03820 [Chloroflexia bacterium]|nr:hypothetical protein [Chloroflexia bacterium]